MQVRITPAPKRPLKLLAWPSGSRDSMSTTSSPDADHARARGGRSQRCGADGAVPYCNVIDDEPIGHEVHARCRRCGARNGTRENARTTARTRQEAAVFSDRMDNSMLRFLTAGESHGQALVTILEGIPAGLALDFAAITAQLHRRQLGYGRGRRMAIESDRAQVLERRPPRGDDRRDRSRCSFRTRTGRTGSAPWRSRRRRPPTRLASIVPWSRGRGPDTPISPASPSTDQADIRNILERASARETAARVAVGAIARQLLKAHRHRDRQPRLRDRAGVARRSARRDVSRQVQAIPDDSPLHCVDPEVERAMMRAIDAAREAGDTMGGSFEVSRTACRRASAATCNGIESSMGGWPRR